MLFVNHFRIKYTGPPCTALSGDSLFELNDRRTAGLTRIARKRRRRPLPWCAPTPGHPRRRLGPPHLPRLLPMLQFHPEVTTAHQSRRRRFSAAEMPHCQCASSVSLITHCLARSHPAAALELSVKAYRRRSRRRAHGSHTTAVAAVAVTARPCALRAL
jgi:hypothetical protein